MIKRSTLIRGISGIILLFLASCLNKEKPISSDAIKGLTGRIDSVKIEVPAADKITLLAESKLPEDIDLKRMSQWAMNYLICSPRKELNYQPVFQCYPLRCPPYPEGDDPVVNGDTDSRMDWEWYFMRDVSGCKAGKDIEAAFHKRIINYVEKDGGFWTHPGCYNEGNIHAKYTPKDYIYHTWGACKIIKSLSEDYIRTGNNESKELARKVMLYMKKQAVWKSKDTCYFKQGMGALRRDGSILSNGWNKQPAPAVEPLVTYYLATGDEEGLEFAEAYANGIIQNTYSEGLVFMPDGSFAKPLGHSHATMHALWGIAHLGFVTGKKEYVDFVKRSWDWMLTRGTGTGWFPAMPDNCNETCCISDMMSCAACIAQAGHPEYYDYVERYLRNYISNLQFIVTDSFEQYYRRVNIKSKPEEIEKALTNLKKVQGAIIGGSGINDWENELLGGISGFAMFGCCAPEGMRAIYTTWSNTILRLPASSLGPKGIYVNMSFTRNSSLGDVVSFMPDQGRITVKANVKDVFFIRPPHWAPKDDVKAFINTKSVLTEWTGDYVRFETGPGDELTITYPLISFSHTVEGIWKDSAPKLKVTFNWLGNMVVSTNPAPAKTPLFIGRPRILPSPPAEIIK
jgi:hypothetical protein